MTGSDTMPPDTRQALAMLEAFASVGATLFDVTLLDIHENQTGFQSARSVDELRRKVSGRLEAASRLGNNIVIRPRSPRALLIQLDDFDNDRAEKIAAHAFMVVRTSPNNNQVWIAVSDGPKDSDKEAAKQFRKRVRAGAGADKQATGATRLAGTLNIKPKYAPDFPIVMLSHTQAGKTVIVAELEKAGLLAPSEAVTPPPRRVPIQPRSGPAPKSWPDYRRCLQGAPLAKDGSGGPDRSLADFMWSKWAIQRGWTIDETAEKLMEVSDKARERASRHDDNYALLTARNAHAALERDRSQRQRLKSTPDPR